MRENVGQLDRTIRTVVGSAMLLRGFGRLVFRGRFRGLFGAIAGALVLESALTRVCPLNKALGIDTRSNLERMKDFRADVNEQSDRITSEYGKPTESEPATAAAPRPS